MRPVVAILLPFSFVFAIASAHADGLSVVDVRKNIALSDNEPSYKDFYLAGGDISGLKKNLVVTAIRKVGVRDAKGAQSYGEIDVPVGQLRILAVYGSVAVAREYKILSRDENPMLEQTGIMSGDLIDLKASFVDTKPLPKPKSVSEIEAESTGRSVASTATEEVATPAAVAAAPTTASPSAETAPVEPATATAVTPTNASGSPAAANPAVNPTTASPATPAPAAKGPAPASVPAASPVSEAEKDAAPGLPVDFLEPENVFNAPKASVAGAEDEEKAAR